MGLYNTIFGEQPAGRSLLELLYLVQPLDPGRYRDAWVELEDDHVLIRVHTRNGGGNREAQVEPITSMQSHPWYVRDEDGTFDSTYADFYFRPNSADIGDGVSAEVEMAMRSLVGMAVTHVDMDQRWKDAIDSISKNK